MTQFWSISLRHAQRFPGPSPVFLPNPNPQMGVTDKTGNQEHPYEKAPGYKVAGSYGGRSAQAGALRCYACNRVGHVGRIGKMLVETRKSDICSLFHKS